MLEFVFWDVQHGNACYIHTPNGRHIVIDLGTGSYSENKPFSPLLHLKKNYGVQQLDYVVVTHPHRDHIDDIFNFGKLAPSTFRTARHLTDAEVLAGNRTGDKEKVQEYLKVRASYDVSVEKGSASDATAPAQWGGVKMSFFTSYGCSTTNLNNHSIVTIFEHADSRVMIPGDNEAASWKELIKDTGFVAAAKNVDVLLAPHHGRKAGYCGELFEAIGKVYITVISDGPEGETSVTGSYGSQSRGWRVYYPDSSYEEKYCVTTRDNGVIRVKAYFAENGKPRLNVHVQKGGPKA